MVNYFDYASQYTVYDDNVQSYINILGMSYTPDFYPYKNYYLKYIIKPEEQYRPDKIAFNLLGNQSLSWVFDCINFFKNGIEEYYAGREINYLERDVLKKLGIM